MSLRFIVALVFLTFVVSISRAGEGRKSDDNNADAVQSGSNGQLNYPGLIRVIEDQERLSNEKALSSTKPITGLDDRKDWGLFNSNQILRSQARASVALFHSKNLISNQNGRFELPKITLGNSLNLCREERFADQIRGAHCSGVLVASNKILTAGHCFKETFPRNPEAPTLKDTLFVFGYFSEDENSLGQSSFSDRQVYRGHEVQGSVIGDYGDDYAIVKLTRSVPKNIAEPIKLFSNQRITDRAEVYVLGYPSGIPIKYAPGAKVIRNDYESVFATDLDTFAANSGSGVFDARTKKLVGTLVSGYTDYYIDKTSNCKRAFRCGDKDCNGEFVMRVERILNKIGKSD